MLEDVLLERSLDETVDDDAALHRAPYDIQEGTRPNNSHTDLPLGKKSSCTVCWSTREADAEANDSIDLGSTFVSCVAKRKGGKGGSAQEYTMHSASGNHQYHKSGARPCRESSSREDSAKEWHRRKQRKQQQQQTEGTRQQAADHQGKAVAQNEEDATAAQKDEATEARQQAEQRSHGR